MELGEIFLLPMPSGDDWATIASHPCGLRYVRNGVSGNTAFGGPARRIRTGPKKKPRCACGKYVDSASSRKRSPAHSCW